MRKQRPPLVLPAAPRRSKWQRSIRQVICSKQSWPLWPAPSPGSFPNCFACHNTQAVTARGIPANKDGVSPVLLEAKRINVSHIFSQFVLEETQP
jgi:hypothetical protein